MKLSRIFVFSFFLANLLGIAKSGSRILFPDSSTTEENFVIQLRIAGGQKAKINHVAVVPQVNVPKKYKDKRFRVKCLEWEQEPITNRWKCLKFGTRPK